MHFFFFAWWQDNRRERTLTRPTLRDNLEFLQWIKKFWDQNYAGGEYDAVGRRKGAPGDPPATIAPASTRTAANGAAARVGGGRTPVGGPRAGSSLHANNDATVQALTGQVHELGTQLEGLEKERDFYFEKVCCASRFFSTGNPMYSFPFAVVAPRH